MRGQIATKYLNSNSEVENFCSRSRDSSDGKRDFCRLWQSLDVRKHPEPVLQQRGNELEARRNALNASGSDRESCDWAFATSSLISKSCGRVIAWRGSRATLAKGEVKPRGRVMNLRRVGLPGLGLIGAFAAPGLAAGCAKRTNFYPQAKAGGLQLVGQLF